MSTHLLQLNPSIPLGTPKGPGEAILALDYGKEDHTMFLVIIDATGELWTFPSLECRGLKNISIGRDLKPPLKDIPTPLIMDQPF